MYVLDPVPTLKWVLENQPWRWKYYHKQVVTKDHKAICEHTSKQVATLDPGSWIKYLYKNIYFLNMPLGVEMWPINKP